MTAREVAPRLWRALQAERAYQERRRAEFRRGLVSMTVAMEQMTRAMRPLTTAALTAAEAMSRLAEQYGALERPRR